MSRVADRETSNSANSHQPQVVPVEQQFIKIDERLYRASVFIEDFRKALRESKPGLGISATKYATEAYNALYAQHELTVKELNEMTEKCLSMSRELEESERSKSVLEARIQHFEK